MNFCWNALAPQIRRRKRKHPVGTHETWPYFGLTLEEASHAVRASERTLRRIIREDGFRRRQHSKAIEIGRKRSKSVEIGLMPSLVPVQKPINQEHPLPAIYATNEELSANQHIDHISWDSPCHVPIFYDSPP
ncbi:hypothetical protein Tco_1167797 [Tanacetum coccineum]